jgi:predicted aspartyl protease
VPNPVTSPALSPSPRPPAPVAASEAYQRALDKAESARNISASAQSQDDWDLAVSGWQQAIVLLRTVPASSSLRPQVDRKLREFQQNLATAKAQAAQAAATEARFDPRAPLPPVAPPAQRGGTGAIASRSPRQTERDTSATASVFQAQIKRRASGTPVIDVTLNGQLTVEMIVDTGASKTVITRQVAESLNAPLVGSAQVNTASDRNVEVALARVESIAVGGAQMQNVTVAVGGEALPIGLLGQDFFGNYDITVKQSVVEFRPR